MQDNAHSIHHNSIKIINLPKIVVTKLIELTKSIGQYVAVCGTFLISGLILPFKILKILFGMILGYIIVPAKSRTFPDWDISLDVRSQQVETEDNIKLDTLIIKYENGEKINYDDNKLVRENAYYIIYFLGNFELYEFAVSPIKVHLEKLSQDATIIASLFNYRNVGRSTGVLKSSRDLLKDGKAQVDYFLNHGVLPKQIILYGHSLGGAIATQVKSEYFLNNEIKLFVDRTFSSITAVVFQHIQSGLGSIVSQILKPVVKSILKLTDWEMNIATAFKKIPDSYKTLITAEYDSIIPRKASLYEALPAEYIQKRKQTLFYCPTDAHNIPLIDLINYDIHFLHNGRNEDPFKEFIFPKEEKRMVYCSR